nr:aminotransferase class IV [Gammaproteobacteria bacterium]
EYVPQEEAKISIMDRGFLFGDGVYEVIPVYRGNLFGFEEHITRLNQSLNCIHIKPFMDQEEWRTVCKTLLKKNNVSKDGVSHDIYLQITRGTDTTRSHAIPHDIKPTVVAFCTEARSKSKEEASQGFSAITLDDTRRKENYIKAIALLPNILLYEQARRENALEAILIRNNKVLEGTSSNLFMTKDGILYTPLLTGDILEGVTRRLILEIAKEHDIPFKETDIDRDMLRNADEIWVTGSSKEICPIIELDKNSVGTGKVGPLWHKMRDLYDAKKQALLQGE